MACWHHFKRSNFAGIRKLFSKGKEKPGQDLGYFEGVSPTIYEIWREGVRWKYRSIRSR